MLKALYLPLKYRQPVICNFRRRHTDIPIKDQMQKLQENYCWLGMREDIAEHSRTCNNCQGLQQAKKSPQIPNATVHLDIHGPFVSYGENKLVVTLTDKATKKRSNPKPSTPWPTPSSLIGSVVRLFHRSLTPIWTSNRRMISKQSSTTIYRKRPRTICSSTSIVVHVTTKKPPTSLPRQSPEPNLVGKILYRPSTWPTTRPINSQLHHLRFNYGYAPKFPTTNLEAATSASTFAQEQFLTF